MDDVIIFAAKYLIYIMVVGFAAVWLLAETTNTDRIKVVVSAVMGLILVGIFIKVGASLHNDPRPFAVNTNLKPLINHARDNGFPSDHSAAVGLMATLVLWRHQILGLIFAAGAVAVAGARAAAHVHHLQDVAAGLALGAIAAVIAMLIAPLLIDFVNQRRGASLHDA